MSALPGLDSAAQGPPGRHASGRKDWSSQTFLSNLRQLPTAFGRFTEELWAASTRCSGGEGFQPAALPTACSAQPAAPQSAKNVFPALLPFTVRMRSVSKSGRMRKRRRGKLEAEEWCNYLFSLFSFWECNSPSTPMAVHKAVHRAIGNRGNELHKRFAMNLCEDLLSYSRLPAVPPGGRGAANLIASLEALKISEYTQ